MEEKVIRRNAKFSLNIHNMNNQPNNYNEQEDFSAMDYFIKGFNLLMEIEEDSGNPEKKFALNFENWKKKLDEHKLTMSFWSLKKQYNSSDELFRGERIFQQRAMQSSESQQVLDFWEWYFHSEKERIADLLTENPATLPNLKTVRIMVKELLEDNPYK